MLPSPGLAKAVVTNPAVICAAVKTMLWGVVPSVIVMVSPTKAPAGTLTFTSTSPDNSALLIRPSLLISSVIVTVGAKRSLSIMVAAPDTPPTFKVKVSLPSLMPSSVVDTVAANSVTPAGTVIFPVLEL